MKDVLIHSPYPLDSSQGNSVSAERLERILLEAGLTTLMEGENYDGADARCMVALNARRSAKAIADFHTKHPKRKIIVILTGTDINHPEAGREGSLTQQSMEKANCLVLLHDASLVAVPDPFKVKCTVIFPSVTLPEGLEHMPVGKNFSVIMSGNMRAEKNPELAVEAQLMMPADINIHVYGKFDGNGASLIIEHGVVAHQEMLVAMSKSHILLNTSIQEGGANAICEAVSMGLPVVASAIPGNIGLLGEDYDGLFTSNDSTGLISLLSKVATDPELYTRLKKQVAARAPLFAYSTEAAAWVDLVRSQLSH